MCNFLIIDVNVNLYVKFSSFHFCCITSACHVSPETVPKLQCVGPTISCFASIWKNKLQQLFALFSASTYQSITPYLNKSNKNSILHLIHSIWNYAIPLYISLTASKKLKKSLFIPYSPKFPWLLISRYTNPLLFFIYYIPFVSCCQTCKIYVINICKFVSTHR